MKKRRKALGTDRYLRVSEAAREMCCSVGKLNNDRSRACGAPYIKLGGSVLYELDDIHAYMSSKKIRPEG